MSFLEGLLWLTLNIYHEARSEPEIGQLAVAHVTLNRALEKNRSIEQVVTAPYQFSWTFQKASYLPTEISPLQESIRIALKALTEPDFTNGSTYYHHKEITPDWVEEMTFVELYGVHKFYKKK